MLESNILKTILLKLPVNVRLFRNNTAKGWAGKVVARTSHTVTIGNPHPLNAGLVKGSSDLIGFTTIEITPEMVGKKIAVFTAVEAKQPGKKPTPEQVNFINAVKAYGGYAGIATNENDINEIIK